ncbi:MAG TPA: recombinase family protein, partial [Pseudothermotoga sp.]
MAKVRVIPSTINPVTFSPLGQLSRRKVAAYARVSTDDEEQATSYDTQVKHYTEFIQKKPEWEFVKVYADDGISGTSTKRREGFNEMIKDALDGKIDLIITKSISRFARNTLD